MNELKIRDVTLEDAAVIAEIYNASIAAGGSLSKSWLTSILR